MATRDENMASSQSVRGRRDTQGREGAARLGWLRRGLDGHPTGRDGSRTYEASLGDERAAPRRAYMLAAVDATSPRAFDSRQMARFQEVEMKTLKTPHTGVSTQLFLTLIATGKSQISFTT